MVPLTFAQTREALERGEATCAEIAEGFLHTIEAKNKGINAFTYVDPAGVRNQATAVDQALKHGKRLPLAGLVLGIKDVLCIEDWPVTCSSKILAGFISSFDATAIARLRAAGAIFIGRTNCDEFAMGSTNESSYYGPVTHPQCAGYVSGGSSGGSAAAVAAGLCHAALGTDTGGSVRQPAAFCGVVGLKPTYGRVSRNGLIAYASSFDCIGILTQNIEDAACILSVMEGKDPWDATSAPDSRISYGHTLAREEKGLRIGLPMEYFGAGLDFEVHQAINRLAEDLEEAGATVSTVNLPHTDYGVAAYYILAAAEASSNLARFDGIRYGYQQKSVTDGSTADLYTVTRSDGFGFEVKRRIMLGTYVLSSGYYDAYYGKAQRVRTLIRQDFYRVFEEVDILLTPVSPVAGARLGEWGRDPLQMYLSDIYTVTANLAGIPGVSVPIGDHSSGLPAAVQLMAKPFDEYTLLQTGRMIMQLRDTEQ